MNKTAAIRWRDIFEIPNLISVLRILLTPIIGYYLWLNTNQAILICAILLFIAGISDFLDGYLARRLNKITPLGHFLDPLADKLFATVLILELVFLRDFPIWLAVIIVARDIIILLGGAKIIKENDFIPSSTLSGKYYFGALAVLLSCYVIRFSFGQNLFLHITIILYILSSYEYSHRLYMIFKGQDVPIFRDKRIYKLIRIPIVLFIVVVFLYKLYEQYFGF